MILATALDVMARPWAWGRADCCTAACDVFERLHGVDPMMPLRGRYASARTARRIILRWGGFEAMAEGLALRAGLAPGEGAAGEIGVTDDAGDGEPALVIGVGGGVWLGKTETGMQRVEGVRRCWRA